MTNKEKYQIWVKEQEDIPIFFQPWYLDVIAIDNTWDVVLYEENNCIKAALPYCFKKKMGFIKIVMPAFCPYLGPWIKYPTDATEYERRSLEKKVIQACLKGLPKFDDFRQKLYPGFDNWLPFYWAGFEQSTRYTYIIPYGKQVHPKTFYKDSLRRQINKAGKLIEIQEVENVSGYFCLFEASFLKQNIPMPVTQEMLSNFFAKVSKQGNAKAYLAKDVDNQPLATVMVIWDKHTTYYMAGGYDERFAQTGAMSGLFAHAISEAYARQQSFNFEGSMLENLEQYFRSFGGKLTPVLSIWKTNSKILKQFI